MTPRHHRRSWMDGALALVDRLPGPAWAAYAVFTVLSIAVTLASRVPERAPVDALTIVFAGLTFVPFVIMHYVNRAAGRALQEFRPALGELESGYSTFERQLTSTSAVTGIVGAIIGLVVPMLGIITTGGAWGVSADNGVASNVVTFVLQALLNAGLATFLLHEVGHLRTITHIHRLATNIQLWNVPPQNAFARVTVLTAMAITVPFVTAGVLSALTTTNPVIAIVIMVVGLGISTLLFVGPLAGMRRRLVREKQQLLGETDRAFEALGARLRRDAEAGVLADASQLDSLIGALNIERERLRKVSTWPWNADTLRAFITTLVVPVVLWFLTTVLGRLLFG
jgi:hypothetical protein